AHRRARLARGRMATYGCANSRCRCWPPGNFAPRAPFSPPQPRAELLEIVALDIEIEVDMKQKNFAIGVWGALLGTLLWLSVAAAQAPATVPNYIIGPGDELQVFVWQNKDLSVTVPVRPDGKISTPLDEDMVAVGKTPSQLAHDIEVKLSEYVRSPHVNVIVTKPASL